MKCDECGEWGVGSRHACLPAWECALTEHVDDDGERVEVRALDADDAAEAFAREWWEGGDYPDSGETMDVAVFVEGKPVRYDVTADYSLDLHVSKTEGAP